MKKIIPVHFRQTTLAPLFAKGQLSLAVEILRRSSRAYRGADPNHDRELNEKRIRMEMDEWNGGRSPDVW